MATEVYMNSKFLFKRGTAARWEELNLVLEKGEPGFETDTYRMKIGDGVTAYNNLPYTDEGNIFNAKTHFDFPSIGRSNMIYKAEDEALLYQWNNTKLTYEKLVSTEGGNALDIDCIWGGDADGIY